MDLVYRYSSQDGQVVKKERIAKGIRYLGYYKNGYAHGTFWAAMVGGKPQGHMHGTIHPSDATISGNNLAYVYPDMETTFLGTFENSEMIDAQESAVLNVDCDENGLLYISKYAAPNVDSPHFYYGPPSNVSFGAGPPGIRDPYEQKWLVHRESKIAGGGEGVFSKRDLKLGELAAIFSGYVYAGNEKQYYSNQCWLNTTIGIDDRRKCVKYSLEHAFKNATISIPPHAQQPGMFIPSLGPKVQLYFRLHLNNYGNIATVEIYIKQKALGKHYGHLFAI